MRLHPSNLFIILGFFVSLGACGGIESEPRSCPNGSCETACAGGTFASGGSCVPFSECPAGTYVAQAGNSSMDQVCSACPNGTYSLGADSAACTPWKTCAAGTYVSNAPSARANRVCDPCANGTYSNMDNQSLCLAANDCPAGTVQTASQSPTSAPACTSCQVGQFCAGGTAEAVACAGDKWDNDGNPATDCVAKTVCPAGAVVVQPGSASTDRTCAPCSSGSFTTASNATRCSPWSTCAPGSYVANQPSPLSDRQCVPCAAGTFSSAENQSSCLAANACPAGSVQVAAGTADSAPVCTPCSKGQYCPGGDLPAKTCPNGTWDHDGNPATGCVTWTVCAAGTYVSTPGSASIDQACSACPQGTFSDSLSSPACSPWSNCPAGTYVVGFSSPTSNQRCGDCPAGSFTTMPNQNACVGSGPCPAGTVQQVAGTLTSPPVCSTCKWGQYCKGDTTPAVDCATGTWDNDANPATVCVPWTPCPAGSGVVAPGSATTDQRCAVITTRTFTTCGATGRLGPSQVQCNTAYAGSPEATEVTISGSGIQQWTVPATGLYRIQALGAQGASAQSGRLGGRGASMRGDFVLTAGTVLHIVVGQMGLGQNSGSNGGGGGGSFVVTSTGTPLLIAGGGGGTRAQASVNGFDASTGLDGVAGRRNSDGTGGVVAGGTAGNGGAYASSWGSGGGGLLGNGANDGSYGTGGESFMSGARGGSATGCSGYPAAPGGFGGGGSGNGCWGGGGGGGYSGGGGAYVAGGGGSYNDGTNQANQAGIQSGDGYVTLEFFGSPG